MASTVLRSPCVVRWLFLYYRGHSLLAYCPLSFAVVACLALPTEDGLAVEQVFDFANFFTPSSLVATWIAGPAGRREGLQHALAGRVTG